MSDEGWTAPGGGSGRPEPQPPQQPFPAPPQEPAPGQSGFSQPGHPGWGQPGAAGAQPAYPAQPQFQQAPQRPPYVSPGQLDLRPGIIPLRPLTMNDVFGAVFRAVRGNVGATVGLAAVTSLIFLVPFTALGAWVSSQEESISLEESVTNDTAGLLGSLGSFIPSVGSWLSTILLTGFLAYVIGQAALGRKVSAGETWRGTIRRIWPLIGATLVTVLIYVVTIGALVAVPIALLVAGGTSGSDGTVAAGVALLLFAAFLAALAMLFLWTRLAFVTPSVILENLSVGKAFARSWRLTGGNLFWRLLGIRLLAAIVIGIAGSIITLPLALLAGGLAFTGIPLDQMYVWQAVLSGVTGVIAGAITTPITAGLDAVLYVDHRIRREGLDVQLIQTVQGTAGAPWPRASA
ncbi:glycerophosphoryl diester phosphodiesterase membrane domain-containing protein [Knoellia sp. CPCC 206453]|uniref:glycerophosphoryl diester phosphodiesterase membrane domain-containing protein n=1 Tax=Knoellia pratensis TaxID=3404796 RepID=UPI0036164A57